MSRDQQQTCKICGRPDKFDFYVPDQVWMQVTDPDCADRVACLYCFDELAARKGVDYSSALRVVHFAGTAASFVFRTEIAVSTVP